MCVEGRMAMACCVVCVNVCVCVCVCDGHGLYMHVCAYVCVCVVWAGIKSCSEPVMESMNKQRTLCTVFCSVHARLCIYLVSVIVCVCTRNATLPSLRDSVYVCTCNATLPS